MRDAAHGLVIGKLYPLHAGHSLLIRAAEARCERVTVQVLGSSVESVPIATRVAWVREEHPNVHVVGALDDAPVDFGSAAAWDAHTAVIEGLLDRPVDLVASGEAYGAELARRLDARHLLVERSLLPVSATAVRADPAALWWALGPAVRSSLCARVVVLGAESTGTTTLAAALAAAMRTTWVPEYGRTHSTERPGGLATPWRSDEFELIADRQAALEADAARSAPAPVVVCDTDVLATALWHERYVGSLPRHLLDRAAAHPPALYVLTGDEIPFEQDGWRDGEHIRHAMQQRFRDVLDEQAVPWLEVHGPVEDRVAAARPRVEEAVRAALRFAPTLEERARQGPSVR